jgi:hypothetical protein
MAIDASIYGQIQQPQIQDPLNALAKVAQVSSLQNQNRLADLAYNNAQRDQESQNALANAYKAAVDPTTGTVDRNKLFTGLAQAGQGAKVPALQEQFAKTDTALLAQQKAKIEQGLQHFEVVGRIMSGVKDQATYDAARQQAAQMFGPEAAANLPPVYDPATIARNQQQALSIKDQLEQKWKALDVDLKERQFGETVRNNRTQNSIAQGNLGVAQANLGLRKQELEQKKTTDRQSAASTQKVNDAKDVLGLLDEVDALLPKATSGAIGTGVDMAAGAFGHSTDGATATAQLKALQGALISKMPKMSGPQSDKDVQLYREMAGQVADPLVPRAQRQAASATIRKLNEKYAGMPEGSSKSGGGVIDFGSLK